MRWCRTFAADTTSWPLTRRRTCGWPSRSTSWPRRCDSAGGWSFNMHCVRAMQQRLPDFRPGCSDARSCAFSVRSRSARSRRARARHEAPERSKLPAPSVSRSTELGEALLRLAVHRGEVATHGQARTVSRERAGPQRLAVGVGEPARVDVAVGSGLAHQVVRGAGFAEATGHGAAVVGVGADVQPGADDHDRLGSAQAVVPPDLHTDALPIFAAATRPLGAEVDLAGVDR